MDRQVQRIDYERVRRLPLGVVLTYLGLAETLKRSGKRFVGACPVHRGTNKRQFVVEPDKGTWFCFGDCNRGGAGIELVAGIEGISHHLAAERIASWFSIPPLTEALSTRRLTMSETKGASPDFKVFAVEDKKMIMVDGKEVEDPDHDPFWTRIGSAWAWKTAKGHGVNVTLSALPVNNRLVLVEYSDEDAKKEEERRASKTQRYSKR